MSAGLEKDRTRHADGSPMTQNKNLTQQQKKKTTPLFFAISVTTFRESENPKCVASEINVNQRLNGPINIISELHFEKKTIKKKKKKFLFL